MRLDRSAVLAIYAQGALKSITALFGKKCDNTYDTCWKYVVILTENSGSVNAVDIHGQLVDAYETQVGEGLPLPIYFDAVINEAVNEYGLTEDIVKSSYQDLHRRLDQNLPSKTDLGGTSLFSQRKTARLESGQCRPRSKTEVRLS